jgi:deoxyribodipyrimidine photolyase-related protein
VEGTLVLGDQLFRQPLAAGPAFMREDLALCTRVRHHKKKLVLFLSAMRHYAGALRADGRRVEYQELGSDDLSYFSALEAWCQRRGIEVLHTFEPADDFFRRELEAWAVRSGIGLRLHPNPMFLTPTGDWDAYTASARKLKMADFYVRQRRRLGLLVEEGQPVGGRWSFDADNRKPLPRGVRPPAVSGCEPDATTLEVARLVDSRFPDHPGSTAGFAYPVTHREADQWLEQFLEERLDFFGDYEDALPTAERTVFHSLLTPMLNTGLLTPADVVQRTLSRHAVRPVPLNCLEGFLRQIVGWREFIRGVDRVYAETGAHRTRRGGRKLGSGWWTGQTGLPPLDLSIRRTLEHGWCHHIERLMVIGSAMLMAEVDPDEAYRWFMEMFVDSADWVMRPNVYGMSQFADGGLFATKPYLSGSAYLRKMGDYAPGPWQDVWDGLYWRYVDRHRDLFASNPRMWAVAKGLDRLSRERRERIFAAAEHWIARATR